MFVGTPFGLIPTSAVLQRTMRRVLDGSRAARAFLDDIPVSSLVEDHDLDDLIETLDRLTAVNLRVNLRGYTCSRRNFTC